MHLLNAQNITKYKSNSYCKLFKLFDYPHQVSYSHFQVYSVLYHPHAGQACLVRLSFFCLQSSLSRCVLLDQIRYRSIPAPPVHPYMLMLNYLIWFKKVRHWLKEHDQDFQTLPRLQDPGSRIQAELPNHLRSNHLDRRVGSMDPPSHIMSPDTRISFKHSTLNTRF